MKKLKVILWVNVEAYKEKYGIDITNPKYIENVFRGLPPEMAKYETEVIED